MNRTSLLRTLAALTLLAIGCAGPLGCSSTSTDASADADGGDGSTDCKGTKPDCISECGSDLGFAATCSAGAWVCTKGVDNATCACTQGYAGIACMDCDGKFAGGAQCNPSTKTYACPPLACPLDAGPDAPLVDAAVVDAAVD